MPPSRRVAACSHVCPACEMVLHSIRRELGLRKNADGRTRTNMKDTKDTKDTKVHGGRGAQHRSVVVATQGGQNGRVFVFVLRFYSSLAGDGGVVYGKFSPHLPMGVLGCQGA